MKKRESELIYSNSSTAQNDVKYISGFDAPDPVLLFCLPNQNILFVSEMEKGRAFKEVKENVEVISPSDIITNKKKSHDTANYILEILKIKNIKKINVDKEFPLGIYNYLKGRIEIEVVELSVRKKRRKKSAAEIDKIRYCQRIASLAIKVAVKIIENSTIKKDKTLALKGKNLTSELVKKEVQKFLLDKGFSGADIIIAGGKQSADPHERGSGKLLANSPIIIDIFPRNEKTKYWGDMTRTICKGNPSVELLKMYKAVHAAQKRAIYSLKEGVNGADIHNSIVNFFDKSGFFTSMNNGIPSGFIHGTGHGVGLDIHESPRINFSREKLKEGDIITIEPGLYYPSIGGIRIEDLILVEKNGYSVLGTCTKKFIIR